MWADADEDDPNRAVGSGAADLERNIEAAKGADLPISAIWLFPLTGTFLVLVASGAVAYFFALPRLGALHIINQVSALFMQHTSTVVQRDGPDHLGLRCNARP